MTCFAWMSPRREAKVIASEPLFRHTKRSKGQGPGRRWPISASSARIEPRLARAGGHDVGHDVGLVHGVEHRLRCMPKPEHAVAARIVNDGAHGGHDPRSARGKGDVRVDEVVGIEVEIPALQLPHLLGLGETGEVRQFALESAMAFRGFGNRLAQQGVAGGETLDDGVREAGGDARTALLSDLAQDRQRVAGHRHSAGSGVVVALRAAGQARNPAGECKPRSGREQRAIPPADRPPAQGLYT